MKCTSLELEPYLPPLGSSQHQLQRRIRRLHRNRPLPPHLKPSWIPYHPSHDLAVPGIRALHVAKTPVARARLLPDGRLQERKAAQIERARKRAGKCNLRWRVGGGEGSLDASATWGRRGGARIRCERRNERGVGRLREDVECGVGASSGGRCEFDGRMDRAVGEQRASLNSMKPR